MDGVAFTVVVSHIDQLETPVIPHRTQDGLVHLEEVHAGPPTVVVDPSLLCLRST